MFGAPAEMFEQDTATSRIELSAVTLRTCQPHPNLVCFLKYLVEKVNVKIYEDRVNTRHKIDNMTTPTRLTLELTNREFIKPKRLFDQQSALSGAICTPSLAYVSLRSVHQGSAYFLHSIFLLL